MGTSPLRLYYNKNTRSSGELLVSPDDDGQDGPSVVIRGRGAARASCRVHIVHEHYTLCVIWGRVCAQRLRVGDRPSSSDQVAPPPPPTPPPLSRRRGAHHWRYRPIATRVSCLLPITATTTSAKQSSLFVIIIIIKSDRKRTN